MNELFSLIQRNCKLFFKDRGMFFTSLITPAILLVLYITFLGKVYKDSFESAMPKGFTLPDELINACVGGELVSSLLAVCCVTVAFCSNMLMVQDKVNGTRRDLTMSPVKKSTLAMSYYISTLISTLIVCLATAGLCFIYLANTGWYLSAEDVLCIILDVILLTLFGTALSSVINVFLSSQGQISAVGTIMSAGYGFICGAYMPISNFSEGLQKVISFLPGTYGTSLLRNHALRGTFEEMKSQNVPENLVDGIAESIDCNPEFFGNSIEIGTMYIIMTVSVILLIGIYILINALHSKKS